MDLLKFKSRISVPPEIKPIILAARRDFAILGATGALNTIAIFTILFEKPGTWIGIVVAVVVFLTIADMGRVLTKKPRSIHLSKARTWAYLLHITVPIGPFVAPRLIETLRLPELVSYAVAEDPIFGTLTDEGIIDLTIIKRSLTSLRSIGGVLLIIVIVLAIVFLVSDYSATHFKSPGIFNEASITLFILFTFAFFYILVSTIGLRLIRSPSRQDIATLRTISLVLLLFLPFGTWTGGLTLFLINPKRADLFP